MPVSEETHKLIAAFQRYVKNSDASEIQDYSLNELKKAERELGWRDKDSGFRLAIQDQIRSLERTSENKSQSRIRAVGYIVALAIAIIAAIVGVMMI